MDVSENILALFVHALLCWVMSYQIAGSAPPSFSLNATIWRRGDIRRKKELHSLRNDLDLSGWEQNKLFEKLQRVWIIWHNLKTSNCAKLHKRLVGKYCQLRCGTHSNALHYNTESTGCRAAKNTPAVWNGMHYLIMMMKTDWTKVSKLQQTHLKSEISLMSLPHRWLIVEIQASFCLWCASWI